MESKYLQRSRFNNVSLHYRLFIIHKFLKLVGVSHTMISKNINQNHRCKVRCLSQVYNACHDELTTLWPSNRDYNYLWLCLLSSTSPLTISATWKGSYDVWQTFSTLTQSHYSGIVASMSQCVHIKYQERLRHLSLFSSNYEKRQTFTPSIDISSTAILFLVYNLS